MDVVLAGLLVVVAGLAVVLWRRRATGSGRSAAPRPARLPVRSRLGPYHAVAITPRSAGCAPARALAGQRFLLDQAPTVPLPGCNAARCTCQYRHYPDRRHHERRSPFRTQYALSGRPDQRSGFDRRRAAPS